MFSAKKVSEVFGSMFRHFNTKQFFHTGGLLGQGGTGIFKLDMVNEITVPLNDETRDRIESITREARERQNKRQRQIMIERVADILEETKSWKHSNEVKAQLIVGALEDIARQKFADITLTFGKHNSEIEKHNFEIQNHEPAAQKPEPEQPPPYGKTTKGFLYD